MIPSRCRGEPGTLNNQFLMVGYQLDDEPNHYMKNGCFTKHPFRTGLFGVPQIGQYHNIDECRQIKHGVET